MKCQPASSAFSFHAPPVDCDTRMREREVTVFENLLHGAFFFKLLILQLLFLVKVWRAAVEEPAVSK
jgi:hypothetical protein